VFVVAATVAIALILLQRRNNLSTDALLGILSHSTLAIGLVMVAFMTWVRVDLMGFLFGDILAVSVGDIALIYGGGAVILLILVAMWRPLLAGTVNAEVAEAEGLRPEVSRVVFMLLLASVIAIAMKLVGVLLITSLLIIPAATARRLSATPEQMAVIAAVLGALAVTGGLFGSLKFDTPSGPSIVVAAMGLFVISIMVPVQLWRKKRQEAR
jgi:zinc transport system permease protein